MIVLHDLTPSINAYKVRLLLAMLKLEHQVEPVDVMAGAHKSPDYVALHPFGQVPLLTDGEEVFWDSHGILVYLAAKYGREAWLPDEPAIRGRIAAWLSVAANEVHHSLFQARVATLFKRNFGVELDVLQKRSLVLLKQLDAYLGARQWLVGERATIADVAIYPAVALAHEGGVDRAGFDAVSAWLARFEELPGYEPINAAPTR